MDDRSLGDVLTIRELVEQTDLRLEVVAGRVGLGRVIEAVYMGDLDDPTPWMVEGSLLLTTGRRFEAEPEVAVHLVHLLRQSGMVGVGVSITPYVREIPAAMLEAADEEGLPLLRVPEGTPFRAITSYVFNALASRDMHRLRRSVALQRQLLDVLVADQDAGGLVRRLGELLGADTLLYNEAGDVLAARYSRAGVQSVEASARRLWAEYRATVRLGASRSVIDLDGRHIAFREVRGLGRVEQVMMAVYGEGSLISEFEDAALTFAQRLLEVELATGRNAAAVLRRTRAGLLDMLLHARGTETELGERLLYHGIEPAEPWRVLIFAVGVGSGSHRDHPSVGDAVGDALLAALDRELEERNIPFVSRRSHAQAIVLSPLPGCDDAGSVSRAVAEIAAAVAARLNAERVEAGVSAATTGSAAVARAARQARLALNHAGREAAPARVVVFEDLGRRYQVLDALGDEQLRELREATVGRLSAADRSAGSVLLATLETYLRHGGSVSASAAELFVHRNTLRKRLRRIEDLLGVDLQSSGGRVEAYLGVRAAEMLAARDD
ncbi:MAG: PucR family transcriptional regulator [Actinomycetes bacterium]